MSNDESKRVTRRDALRGMFTVSAATIVGCGGGESAPDAAMVPADAVASPDVFTPEDPDAGRDSGPEWDAGPAATGPVQHGVASGDPCPTSVMLWTRVSESSGTVTVEWEVATEPTFAALTTSGTSETNADRDFTVKVEATGLVAGTSYYYRFRTGGRVPLSSVPPQSGCLKPLACSVLSR